MSIKKYIIIFLLSSQFFLLGTVDHKKNNYKKEYITVIAGEQYKAGKMHEFLGGKHWRELWITPVKVEVLDLDKFAGGLTPIKKGGGQQTKSLRFLGKDGSYWKFRFINKDPKSALPKEFQDTIALSVLQDQISSANPFAPLVVVPILNAVGILQAKPKLVWLKSEKKLGQFREEFGNVLGMIELHPTDKDKGSNQFEDVKKIVNTFKLFKTLEQKSDEKVDQKAFLKARLIDIFLGDWDRHLDQWRWAKFEEKGKKLWKPVPRDRDQAFSKLDGLFPTLTRYLIIHLSHFSEKYTKTRKITWSGRFLDRRYLSELNKTNWDDITKFIKNKITDSVIEDAVKQLPPECFAKAGKELINILKSRRDKLNVISNKYYMQINKVVDIFCSDVNDYVEVNRKDKRYTEISVFKRSKKDGNKKGEPLYHKVFDNRITSEIRIYMNKGDDKAIVSGVAKGSPVIRIIGGSGKDEMVDVSKVKGKFL